VWEMEDLEKNDELPQGVTCVVQCRGGPSYKEKRLVPSGRKGHLLILRPVITTKKRVSGGKNAGTGISRKVVRKGKKREGEDWGFSQTI